MADDQVMKAIDWRVLFLRNPETNKYENISHEEWHVVLRHLKYAGLNRIPTNEKPLWADDYWKAEQRMTIYSTKDGMASWTLWNPIYKPASLDPEEYIGNNPEKTRLKVWWGLIEPSGESWYWAMHLEGKLIGVDSFIDAICVRVGQDYFQ